MSIASEITRIKTNIDNAYTALEAKGATIPETKNSANLADTVATVTGGGGETNYLGRKVLEDGTLILPSEDFTFSLPSNITKINDYALKYACYGPNHLVTVNLSNITSINNCGLDHAFYDCDKLTSVDLSNLRSVTNYGLTYAFAFCTTLTSVDFPNLRKVGQNGLNYAFRRAQNLTSLSFPKLFNHSFIDKGPFFQMLFEVTGCTVHFPSNLESVIGDWADVTDGFGGTNTTVLFDLPHNTATLNFVSDKNIQCAVDDIVFEGTSGDVLIPTANYICYNADDKILLFGEIDNLEGGTTVNITPDFSQNYYTISLNVGIANAVTLTTLMILADTSAYWSFAETDNGIYTLKIIGGIGEQLIYAVMKPDYSEQTSGIVTLTGEDVTINDFTWIPAGG